MYTLSLDLLQPWPVAKNAGAMHMRPPPKTNLVVLDYMPILMLHSFLCTRRQDRIQWAVVIDPGNSYEECSVWDNTVYLRKVSMLAPLVPVTEVIYNLGIFYASTSQGKERN